MPQFRTKVDTVEAVNVGKFITSPADDWTGLPGWLKEIYDDGQLGVSGEGVDLLTDTSDRLGHDDWIVRDRDGHVFGCDAATFEKRYEAVDAGLFDAVEAAGTFA